MQLSFAAVPFYGYNAPVKLRELEKQLRQLGWRIVRESGKLTAWSNGVNEIAIPRHKEINEYTTLRILNRVTGEKLRRFPARRAGKARSLEFVWRNFATRRRCVTWPTWWKRKRSKCLDGIPRRHAPITRLGAAVDR